MSERTALYEEKLGITNQQEHLAETALVIDRPFLYACAIMGEEKDVCHIFGEKEWEGWLKARCFTREYGDQPLTLEFIFEVHRQFFQQIDSSVAGELATDNNMVGCGPSYDKSTEAWPIPLTDAQLESIKNNPLITFYHDPLSDYPEVGFIGYTYAGRKDCRTHLIELCEWYNLQKQEPQHDPYGLAADLQRMFVSLHPLEGYVNGRISRLLMNWSLENDGCDPAMLKMFHDDIWVSSAQWRREVKKGSLDMRELRRRIGRGVMDTVGLLQLGDKRKVYEEHVRDYYPPLTPLEVGNIHDLREYEVFFDLLNAHGHTGSQREKALEKYKWDDQAYHLVLQAVRSARARRIGGVFRAERYVSPVLRSLPLR